MAHLRTRWIWLALVLALAAAACGGGDGDDEPTEAADAADDPTEAAEEEATEEEPAETEAPTEEEPAATEEVSEDGGSEEAAAGGDAENPEPPADLVAAAEEEGSLVFYSVPDESIAQGISEEFMARYDVTVEFVRLVSADLQQRFAAEASTGEPAADLILLSDTPFFGEAFDEGWLTPLPEAGVEYPEAFPEEFITQDGRTAVVSVNGTVLGYNTDLVTEPPTDWTDLASEAAAGNIAISDPTTSAANVFFWNLIRNEYGDELLEQIAANEPTFTGGAVPSAQALAAGEVAYATPQVSAILDGLIAEGAPVDYILPDVTTGSEIAVGISTEAANPNAARLFAHFILTREGNELLTVPYNTASPWGTNLPAGYERPEPAALGTAQEIYSRLGAQ